MKKLDFNIPTYNMLFSIQNGECLGMFEKRGTKSKLTDYATILTCMYEGEEDKVEKEGSYWIDKETLGDSYIAYQTGSFLYAPVNRKIIGVRPIIKASSISNITHDKVLCDDGITEAKFGEYPDSVADEYAAKELEDCYNISLCLNMMTGKQYTHDINVSNENKRFLRTTYPEYYFEGKKYVRVPVNSYLSHSNDGVTLSDNKYYKNNSYVWLEVKPQKVLIDEKKDLAVFENIVLAGIQFNKRRNYKGDFNKTFMKKYLDKYFSKEILPSTKYTDSDLKNKVKSL